MGNLIDKQIAQKEAFEIMLNCQFKYSFNDIKIKVKNIRRGHSYHGTRYISIPFWASERSKEYFTYYVLHEISHIINHDKSGKRGHGCSFKSIEQKLLRDYDLIPIYKKAYIKELKNLNGAVVYKE